MVRDAQARRTWSAVPNDWNRDGRGWTRVGQDRQPRATVGNRYLRRGELFRFFHTFFFFSYPRTFRIARLPIRYTDCSPPGTIRHPRRKHWKNTGIFRIKPCDCRHRRYDVTIVYTKPAIGTAKLVKLYFRSDKYVRWLAFHTVVPRIPRSVKIARVEFLIDCSHFVRLLWSFNILILIRTRMQNGREPLYCIGTEKSRKKEKNKKVEIILRL